MMTDPSAAPTIDGQLPDSPEALQALLGIQGQSSMADQMDAESAARAAADAEKDRQAKLAKDLFSEFTWCREQKDAYYTPLFNDLYDAYRLQVPDERRSGEWRSKIRVPYAYNAVEDVVPHLMEGTWGGEEPFRLKSPANGALVEAYEKIVNWEIEELIDLENLWEDYERQKSIYGTSAMYVGFRNNYRNTKLWTIPKTDPNMIPDDQAPAAPVLISKEIPEYVGPSCEVVDVYDIYPHPRATPNNMIKIFWVQRYTKRQMQKTGRFKNIDQITDGMSDAGGDDMTAVERRYRTGQANSSGRYPSEKIFRIVTCYDEIEKKVTSFTYNGHLIVEESDYPFFHDRCPLVFNRYTTLPLEFWGVGPIETSLSLINEGNSIRNQRRDNVNLIVNAMMEVRVEPGNEDLAVAGAGVAPAANDTSSGHSRRVARRRHVGALYCHGHTLASFCLSCLARSSAACTL